MSDSIDYGSVVVSDVSDMGDNTDRTNWIMLAPSSGETSIVRLKVPTAKRNKVKCIALTLDYEGYLLTGAYAGAQDGARLQVRFGGTVKFEHKFNWTGLSGYIGGADDSGSEAEVMLYANDLQVDASTAIDIYVTGGTNVRRMIYVTLYGTLDDGTRVRAEAKQAVDGTTATAVALYTVPAGRTLYWDCLTISTRHIDLYAGKGYLVYNGLPVMAFDVMQTTLSGLTGLVIPLWDAPVGEGNSLGLRLDDFAAGNEVVSGAVYFKQEDIGGGGGGGNTYSRGRVVNG